MTSKKEQFYIRRIAELEKQVAELLKVNAELVEQAAKLADKIAGLSKNSSNSSKPPSSDIVKPAKIKQSDGPRRQGGHNGTRVSGRFWTPAVSRAVPVGNSFKTPFVPIISKLPLHHYCLKPTDSLNGYSF